MNIDEHIETFWDWSFSMGRPEFAENWGKEEHTRFCFEFLRRQFNGINGLTGPLAVFISTVRDISGEELHKNINVLVAYYIYMNARGGFLGNDTYGGHKNIEIDMDKINRWAVLL